MIQSPRVAIIYFSGSGTTATLAQAIGAGASEIAEVDLRRISGEHIIAGRFSNSNILETVDAANGIVFGSPTYMGGPAAEFKAFADATSDRWTEQRWAGKMAAGFTTGACANGDQGHTLTYFSILAAQHGMLWCGLDIACGYDASGRNRLGGQLGLVSQADGDEVAASDIATAHYLGRRLATVTRN